MIDDFETCYRAVSSKDARFDGVFFTGVLTTGIYCRPSCPAITPKRPNVQFFRTAAAAQLSGLRACKRCRPDATPGSPEWNVRADVVGRAMRLISDGVVDRDGVRGLASRLHFTERHLHRQLVAEVGAGPQALARARRAETARILIETTTMKMADIAFAAGFASIRQFNDTIQAVFAGTPRELRRARRTNGTGGRGTSITLRLPYRPPFAGRQILSFLGERAIAGTEEWDGTTYRRTLALEHGPGIVGLSEGDGFVKCDLSLTDMRDLGPAVARLRALLDLDADPVAIGEVLGATKDLRKIVRKTPGVRMPGAVDGTEMAIRAVLGQQVSVKGARTLAARLVGAFGKKLDHPDGALTHVFPTADILADAALDEIGLPAARRRTLNAIATAIADGTLLLDAGADRDETRAALLEIPGVGPWTASYLEMRALKNPDAFLATDLGVIKAAEKLGIADIEATAEAWRPWRAYAVQYLWARVTDDDI